MNREKKNHIRAQLEERAAMHSAPLWFQALLSEAFFDAGDRLDGLPEGMTPEQFCN